MHNLYLFKIRYAFKIYLALGALYLQYIDTESYIPLVRCNMSFLQVNGLSFADAGGKCKCKFRQ